MNRTYWEYMGVIIPNDINFVPCKDQKNMQYINGYQTTLYSDKKNLTIEEYRKKYGIKIERDIYFYNRQNNLFQIFTSNKLIRNINSINDNFNHIF